YEKFQYSRYAPYIHSSRQFKSDGYVLPYSDSPMDNEIQAEMVYLNMINKATKYIYISTPYLIIDNELATALMLAAKNGVDVRIVTPHKYDKWYVHMCTQANYTELVKAGVKIYEYAPGFIHSKTFVCDDEIATIGTVNLDYRSLYLHFECGTFLYKSKAVKQLKEDYMYMLKDCIEMTEAKCTNVNIFKRVFRSIIRVFSPLL
ncbi:MAG: cardiolipin synthase, partial [Firmicutes bacterium]|nr:cardiolipin synthase [Bacillota bacterium]